MFAPVKESINRKPSTPPGPLERILGGVSIATMLATIPQVINVWFAPSVSGISLVSWAAYLAAACLWFAHGIQKRDPSNYVACVGWIALDGAVVVGIIVRQT